MEMFSIAGRINSAASCAKEAAEKFEQDYNYEDASKFYLSASELYEADNTPTTANSMLNKWNVIAGCNSPSGRRNSQHRMKLSRLDI